MSKRTRRLGWLSIIRLGLVQAALGAIVVLVTSTLNRVMVVEYRMPAVLPGALVAIHYAVQMLRPRFGFGSGRAGRRTPWILGGMALLGLGGVLCAMATVLLGARAWWSIALAIGAYMVVGLGVGAAGTSLLVLLASQVDESRRAAAATIMWVLMILGFAVASTLAGHYLDPYSPQRLMAVMSTAVAVAFVVAAAALWRVEATRDAESRPATLRPTIARPATSRPSMPTAAADLGFRAVLQRVWKEPDARSFTLFIFVSMLAYSAQELLMEPFAGLVFGYSLGASAALSGQQHMGVFLGMIAVGVAGSGRRRFGSLRSWTICGCLASALALLSLAVANAVGPTWPLRASVFALGLSNGAFAVSAIGSMMELSHRGETSGAGVRMGLWGAAQAIAFALGGLLSTGLVDSARYFLGSPSAAFGVVFCAEAALFILAARFAARVGGHAPAYVCAAPVGASSA